MGKPFGLAVLRQSNTTWSLEAKFCNMKTRQISVLERVRVTLQ